MDRVTLERIKPVTTNGERVTKTGQSWLHDDDPPKLAPVRRYLGLVFVVIAGLVLVGVVLGGWNPWSLVPLRVCCGNGRVGAVAFLAALRVGGRAPRPVPSGPTRGRRPWARR